MSFKPFKSYRGDWFAIPESQFKADTAAYAAAVETLDESVMLHYEEGFTGWVYCPDFGAAVSYRAP